jgi:hypothetical protein
MLASRRGHLSEAIGPRAEQLNEAALDLEQIVNSLRQDSADTLDRKGVSPIKGAIPPGVRSIARGGGRLLAHAGSGRPAGGRGLGMAPTSSTA